MGWKTMGSICDTGASQDECCCGNYCALASGQSAGGVGVCQRDDGMVTGGNDTGVRAPREVASQGTQSDPYEPGYPGIAYRTNPNKLWRYLRTGPTEREQSFTNDNQYSGFIMDAQTNGMPDSDYMNHPGFIGCWRGKKKCEARRQEKSYTSINSKYPYSTNDDCDTLQTTITKLDRHIDKEAVDTSGGRGARRVRKRTLNSLERRRIGVRTAYENNECTQKQLAEQEAQFDLRIADMMGQYKQRSTEREGRESTTAYVAIGVGVLVIGGVLMLALRK